MMKTLENPLYYLENFHTVVEWIRQRYSALLSEDEREFISAFPCLPQASRALLVRMVMRKGTLFRASKLQYEEIGSTAQAAEPLIDTGWIDPRPELTLEQLFGLLTKSEIAQAFGSALPKGPMKKADQLDALREAFTGARHFDAWHSGVGDCVYQLQVNDLCDRLRLLFFGNLHQDWSEFVLSDLGLNKYEKVEFSTSSLGFRTRQDVDDYLHLYRCREQYDLGEPVDAILADIPAKPLESGWLEARRAKLLFQIAQHYEQAKAWDSALTLYSQNSFPGARVRAIRVMERCGQFEAAYTLAKSAESLPESEAESQQLMRILPRLHRKLGYPNVSPRTPAPLTRIDLTLPCPTTDYCVEELVRDHLAQADASVHYVENTLINSLFGLLCWDAIFTPIPGAFFHPFQTGPADLFSADFLMRREQEFATCLAQLDSDLHRQTILNNYRAKFGTQSPFVYWDILDENLMHLALECIPAAHLKKWFERILRDIRANRSGFPDLIQFWPQEKRYRMIEVKAPGDRLQDNQVRWLEYCVAHEMPVSVCYVQWEDNAA